MKQEKKKESKWYKYETHNKVAKINTNTKHYSKSIFRRNYMN